MVKGNDACKRSVAGNTPTEEPKEKIGSAKIDFVTPFLQSIADFRMSDPQISAFFKVVERYCKQQHFMTHVDFSVEHPVEEVGRLLTAVLIKHLYLGTIVLHIVEREVKNEAVDELPKQFCDVIKTVHNAKWNLIKIRQEKNCSYKEVCTPIMDRCRFLLHEVRAATSYELNALRRLYLLYTVPRWKRTAKELVNEIRTAKHNPAGKPEDIVNTSIQNQTGDTKKKNKAAESGGKLRLLKLFVLFRRTS